MFELTDQDETLLKAALDDPRMMEAAKEMLRLKSGGRPKGSTGKGGKFYPAAMAPCCNPIRRPSTAYPLSLLAHAGSALHVATVHGIGERVTALRRLVSLLEQHEQLRDPGFVDAWKTQRAARDALAELVGTPVARKGQASQRIVS